MHKDLLELHVNAFREAFETSALRSIAFARFPAGSCGDASMLLAIFLRERLQLETEYICGLRRRHSHGWLETPNLRIDITADQFGAAPGWFFVIGRPSAAHLGFTEDRRYVQSLDSVVCARHRADLQADYATLHAAAVGIVNRTLDNSNSGNGKP